MERYMLKIQQYGDFVGIENSNIWLCSHTMHMLFEIPPDSENFEIVLTTTADDEYCYQIVGGWEARACEFSLKTFETMYEDGMRPIGMVEHVREIVRRFLTDHGICFVYLEYDEKSERSDDATHSCNAK